MRQLWRSLGAVLAATLAVAGCSLPGRVGGPVELTAVFADVGDLVPGHSVQIADVRVGSVTKIELTDDYRAEVTMSLKDDLHIPANSVAVLRTTSLLGEKFVELRAPRDSEGDAIPSTGLLADGDRVSRTEQAPELEFVAEEAVNVLAGVVTNDLAALIQTGAVGFGGRSAELASLLDSLSVVSGTLASQTDDIVTIIDGLDRATATLAGGSDRIDELLVNLADTTTILAENRDLTLQTLEDLTRLAKDQNEIVFQPYRDDLQRQIRQLDSVLQVVVGQREEVGVLVDWLAAFTLKIPKGVPDDFALVYGWFQPVLLEDEQ